MHNPQGIGGTGKPAETGIGGTGQVAHKPGGIGGTGKQSGEGIGGTGNVAQNKQTKPGGIGGTGIVGTITGFGSIWVSNAHITFDEQTPITINQQPASAGAFQLGQVVAVIADKTTGSANTEFDYPAKSIDIIYEVSGPINQILQGKQALDILNQSVLVDHHTAIFDHKSGETLTLAQLDLGDQIEVSGFRRDDGQIVASRLDIVPELDQVQLIGELEQTSEGHWQINNQNLALDKLLAEELLESEELDQRVLVSGQLEGDIFHVESIKADSIEFVLEHVNELIYEGYVSETEEDGTINIGGYEFELEDAIELDEGIDVEEYENQLHDDDEEYFDEDEADTDFYEDDSEQEDYSNQEDEYAEDDFHDEDFEEEYYEDDDALDADFEEEFYEEDMEPEFEDYYYEEDFDPEFEEDFDPEE
ncbi:hypothetical protein GCM10022277_35590 [Litoribacillus peritrichatus]|uniref:DUF5666 domain-containing protein n=1 Tax=Litoribacillus peritrichatus TaxID=718191 RepID=A0ABP7N3C8_9GAMM